MKVEKMYDLDIQINDDGSIRLSQSAGSLEEPSIIDLHPCQLRLVAERAGVVAAPDTSLVDRLHTSHVRRVRTLHKAIGELYCDDFLTEEILERCGSGPEIIMHLLAIHEKSEELVLDLRNLSASLADNLQTDSGHSADEPETPATPTATNGQSASTMQALCKPGESLQLDLKE